MPSTPGNLWMAACETWLRENIWPHVGRQRKPHMNDFTGTWDLGVEATLDPWSKIWQKMDQARGDAENRGLTDYCVWKKRNRAKGEQGAIDPGRGAVIMPAHRFFPLVHRLEKLEQASLEADDQLARGFAMGIEYGRKHPGPVAEEAV